MHNNNEDNQAREDVSFAMKGFIIWFLFFALLFIIPNVIKALS